MSSTRNKDLIENTAYHTNSIKTYLQRSVISVLYLVCKQEELKQKGFADKEIANLALDSRKIKI